MGRLWSFVYPYKLSLKIVPIRRRVHTGWISRNIAQIGEESLIDTDVQICGGYNVIIGSHSCVDRHSALTCVTNGRNTGTIIIGDNVSIGPYAHITSLVSITIGNNIDIGPHCLISDNSKKANISNLEIHPRNRELTSKGVVEIGDYTWIGENVCIMSGVKIGKSCVVGANSVVTHDIPDFSIAAGIPAKVISIIK